MKAEKPELSREDGGGTVGEPGSERQATTACDEHTDEQDVMTIEEVLRRENMLRAYQRVKDKRILLLIWRYLQAGLMEGGVVGQRTEGTPQGGPLSPFLSNVLLDDLDRELERRGHRFVR